jgi:hypothetical protein
MQPPKKTDRRRGSTMVEFALAGGASLALMISTIQLSLGMWNYHTLAYAIHETTRYTAVRGRGCTYPGNTCSVSVGTIANKLKANAIGIPAGSLNVTFTADSGAQITCNPLTTCYSDTTIWPPMTNHDNQIGKKITISARYTMNPVMLGIWPGQTATRFGALTLPASSTQTIIF